MKRIPFIPTLPLVPTLVVTLAIAAMIALGFWQLLDRLPRKEAFLAQLAANPVRPPIPFPTAPDDSLLFRRTSASCDPVSSKLAGAGAAGFRIIVACRAPGLTVQLGTTRNPNFRLDWPGGAVSGFVSHAPDGRSLIGSLFDHSPSRMMLVADTPPPGLSANGRSDVSSVPNNHLAYAVQWFIFAGLAAIIYTLALARRQRKLVPAPQPR